MSQVGSQSGSSSDSDDDHSEAFEFFLKLEQEIPTKIPEFIKRALIVSEMTDELTLSKLKVQDLKEFIDTEKGKKDLRCMLKDKLKKSKTKEFLENPSGIFTIPGNLIRLHGIIEFCQKKQQNHRDMEQKFARVSAKRKSEARSEVSPPDVSVDHSSASTKADEKYRIDILKTVKKKVDQLNIQPPEDRSGLQVPDLQLSQGEKGMQAVLKCVVCPPTNKDITSTLYQKGPSSWKIQNYERHLVRFHVPKSGNENTNTLEKFITKSISNVGNGSSDNKDTEQASSSNNKSNKSVHGEGIQDKVVLSDDEEETLRQNKEQNFS